MNSLTQLPTYGKCYKLQRMYEYRQQRNEMSLDIRPEYFLHKENKSSQKRKKERAFTFQKDFYRPVCMQKALFRNVHILIILKS